MSLALWRLAHLVSQERLFERLREAVGVIHDSDGVPVGHTNVFAEGLQCVWCVAVWLAPLVIVLMVFVPVLMVALALMAGAVLMNAVVEAFSGQG